MRPNDGALRYFGRIKNGTTPASGENEYWDGDVLWATPEDLGKLSGDRISQTRRKVTQKAVDESNLSVLPAKSVIISTRAPIGHMALNSMPMAFNQGCRGIIPGDRVHGPFLYYLLKSRVPELNAMANGTTFVELSRDEFAAVAVEFPPLDTQRRIVRVLDKKTARIDGLTARKERLLELLAERRQALITRVVTKGLDPGAPMKPSGVDWLGDIPAHWEKVMLKRAITFQRGHDLPEASRSEGRVPVISSAGISGWHSAPAARPGIVTGRYGTIGKFHLVERDYWPLNTTLFSIDLCDNEPNFLLFMLENLSGLFLRDASKSAVPGVDRNDIHQIPTAVPPLIEQEEIVKFLSSTLGELSTLMEIYLESIKRLQEYRAALITAAVTGQLDVTEEAV